MNFNPIFYRFSCMEQFKEFVALLNKDAPIVIYYSSDTLALCFLSFTFICSFSFRCSIDDCLMICPSYKSFSCADDFDVLHCANSAFDMTMRMFGEDYED